MTWQILAVITPLFFVIYQSLSKLLPKGISVFLVNTYAFFMGAIVMFIIFLLTSSDKSMALNSKSLPIALGIGALLAVGNAGIIKMFSLGVPQSSFSSVFYPILLIYGVIFGLVFWGEKLNSYQIFGLFLLIAGIILVTKFKN